MTKPKHSALKFTYRGEDRFASSRQDHIVFEMELRLLPDGNEDSRDPRYQNGFESLIDAAMFKYTKKHLA